MYLNGILCVKNPWVNEHKTSSTSLSKCGGTLSSFCEFWPSFGTLALHVWMWISSSCNGFATKIWCDNCEWSTGLRSFCLTKAWWEIDGTIGNTTCLVVKVANTLDEFDKQRTNTMVFNAISPDGCKSYETVPISLPKWFIFGCLLILSHENHWFSCNLTKDMQKRHLNEFLSSKCPYLETFYLSGYKSKQKQTFWLPGRIIQSLSLKCKILCEIVWKSGRKIHEKIMPIWPISPQDLNCYLFMFCCHSDHFFSRCWKFIIQTFCKCHDEKAQKKIVGLLSIDMEVKTLITIFCLFLVSISYSSFLPIWILISRFFCSL